MFQFLILHLKILAIVIVFVDFGACSILKHEKKREEKKTSPSVIYCQPQTPCGWLIYNFVDYPDMNFTNEYCVCQPGQKCVLHEHRVVEGVKEYLCKTKRSALNLPKY